MWLPRTAVSVDARVSTTEQSLESQQQQLRQAGCYEIYSDHGRSGATMARPELEACLRALQPGNTLVVTKLDRLGRTVRGLVELLDSLHERGVAFRSLTEGIDTTTPSGRLMFNIIASVAEMERELIRERTRAGLAQPSETGPETTRTFQRYTGRKPLDLGPKPLIIQMNKWENRSITNSTDSD
ncbi:recombinase family protein [Arthrobacter sp. Edens01]|uniref:recombinase family protein n=2 Tax=unclassified Arthrobacter TaxID=235627 RepID=UPI0006DB855B|nr:recombinase family protein [Arthrobacter sp. Edens01]KPN21730.1 hypothetical protein AO716_01545 [Arthrobacter sp. Edens01]